MFSRNQGIRQDSIGTLGNDMSPRIVYGNDEHFKNGFQLHPITPKLELPQITNSKSPFLLNNETNILKMYSDNKKKKFFLAKRVNSQQINEIVNSPLHSQQQLQAVTLKQLGQRKLSQHSSPIVTPRNSAPSIQNPFTERLKEDQKLNIAQLQGEQSSTANQIQLETPLSLQKERTQSNIKCQENLLPDLSEKTLRKNQSFNTSSLEGFKQQNIFNSKALNIEQKGPRYDEFGKIISRSLVGKPDWFQKKDGQQPLDRDRLKEIAGHKKNSIQIRKQSSFSTLSKQKSENKSKVKHKHQTNKMTKRQLLDQIDIIRERIKKNNEQEKEEIDQLQIDQKMNSTRDQRIMDKHEQNELFWQKIIEKTSASLNRDYSYSQLVRNDCYRSMREATEVFNLCKSDLERYGTKLWEMTLRRKTMKKLNLFNETERDEPPDLIITTDLPYAFQCSSLAGEKKVLQFIRKPIITDPVASIMNNTLDSKGFQTSHQRILQLKSIGENMYHNQNNSIGSQNLTSIIEDQTLLDQIDLNNISSTQEIAAAMQINDTTEKQNNSNLNHSKFNQNPMINITNQQNTLGSDSAKNNQNKNNSSQGFKGDSSLPALKGSQMYFKNSMMNQSNMSFMNSTLQTSQQLQQPFKSLTAQEYYNKRLDEIKELVKDYKTIYEQNVDYQGLAVIGESQLEREVEMIKKADDYTFFNKYKLEEDNCKNNEEDDDLF